MHCSAIFVVHVLKQLSLTWGTNSLDPYGSNVESNSSTLSIVLELVWSWYGAQIDTLQCLRFVFPKFLFPIGYSCNFKIRNSLEN